MFALGFPELIIIIFGLAVIGFELAMLIHIVKDKRTGLGKKTLWIVSILVFQVFAAAYYYLTEYRRRPDTHTAEMIA
ncbi:MAG TPA: hypothetical protein VFT16_04975 [Candidatus Saccharimonadales bacterium]|nr:hypothetical protein [Candidatus Saccharimonadales bacterium]